MTRHVYDPGPDGFCAVCQEADGYCKGTRAARRGTGPADTAPAPIAVPAAVPNGSHPGRQVIVTLASQIRPRPVRWLWPDRIPAGALTLLAGREGIGKSLVGVHLAAELTRGTLPGSRHGRPCRVMFATSEDAWEFTMVPRLLAAGAGLDLIGRVQVEDDGIVTGLTTPVDVPALAAYIGSHDVALLVLDPLTSVMDGRIDAHRDREVRKALEPLAQLAEDTGAAVLGNVHLGKGLGTDPVNLILGSRAFSAVARVALVAARDPDDESSNVLSVEKSNLGRIDVPGLTYRVDGVEIATDEGPASAGLLVWTGETDRRVRDIMADNDGEQTERDEAAEWLTGYLTDNGGEASFADLVKAGRANGHAERTLRRAAKRAGIEITSTGFPRRTIWSLPGAVRPQSGQSGQDTSPGRNGLTVAALDSDGSGQADTSDTPLWDADSFGPHSGRSGQDTRPGPNDPNVAPMDAIGGEPASLDLTPPLSLREDTHEEQERLYPARLAVHRHPGNPEFLPTRAEWADPEAARHAIQTRCFPSERAPSGAEHYLSPAELDELGTLKRELCQSARPPVTAEIKRLRALLPSQEPRKTREHVNWYLALGEDDQAVADQLALLEDARRDLGRMLRHSGPGPRSNPLLRDSFVRADATELVPDRDKLRRYTELLATVDSAHKAAGQAAEDAAVAAEQARRLTDEGWAQELAGREDLEEYFSQGPQVTVTRDSGRP